MTSMRELIDGICRTVAEADAAMESGAFAACGAALSDAEAALREQIQQDTKPAILKLQRLLMDGKPLSRDDRELLRLWIISDAEWYLKHENDFEAWRKDLQRISRELEALRGAALTPQSASHARALLHEAVRLAADIGHFLEYRERVHLFDDSTKELDADERKILLQVLQQKRTSALS